MTGPPIRFRFARSVLSSVTYRGKRHPGAYFEIRLSTPPVQESPMRYALVLAAAAVFAPAAVRAADPPITFQTHPLDRVLSDMRTAADLVGGEKAVKAVNKE